MTTYTFQHIPNNPYANNIPLDTTLSGVNDAGETVGSYNYNGTSTVNAILYNPDLSANNGYVPINIPMASGSWATGINSFGQIVGSTYTNKFNGLSDDDDVFTTIDPPGATSTTLSGINDSGQIVGNYTDSGQTTTPGTGFIYSSGSYQFLTGPTGTIGGVTVTGINNSGEVVGYSEVTLLNPYNTYPSTVATYTADEGFIYDDANGKYTPLYGPNPILDQVFATSINNNGVVAGYYQQVDDVNPNGTPDLGPTQGFIYENGKYTTMDEPGASATYLYGINDTGELIGDNGPSTESFIAKPIPVPPNFFNGDDEADILWQNTSSGDVLLWNSNGTGGFTPQDLGVQSGWQIAGTGDFNGADEAGILWRNASTGGVKLWDPNGSGGFTPDNLGSVNTSWQIAGTGDFTGTGEDSILWRNTNGGAELWNPNGSGGFTYQNIGVVNTSWQIAGTGDFTGTGEDSILWRNTNGDTELWNPAGSGGFTPDDLGVVKTSWQIAGTGDFTGTGEDSILWRNTNGDTKLWNPNGSGGFTPDDLGVVKTSWQIAETGDFTGSGQSGILWRNTSGAAELWNPNGSGGFTPDNLGVVATNWSVQKIFA